MYTGHRVWLFRVLVGTWNRWRHAPHIFTSLLLLRLQNNLLLFSNKNHVFNSALNIICLLCQRIIFVSAALHLNSNILQRL